MENPKHQIQDWLEKLERESWQLELLVSAFTIFLLIQTTVAYDAFLDDVQIKYNLNQATLSIFFIFLLLIGNSIKALTIFLVVHLMLRGFWIGTIGLRSVQSNIDLKEFHYSDFFTTKLEKNMVSLDKMVVRLDEVCSVIFSFAFLIISILLSFGLFFCFFGLLGLMFNSVAELLPESFHTLYTFFAGGIMSLVLLSGLVYMIDYFTLGFFKKFKRFARVYYPFYRLYHYVTLAGLSKSIYYYMIGKFSKKKIRILYLVIAGILSIMFLFEFDQYQYFPKSSGKALMSSNCYDDQRGDGHIVSASIPSRVIHGEFLELFIRYKPEDNKLIKLACTQFEPLKKDGINWRLEARVKDGNFVITNPDYTNEQSEEMLQCLSTIFEVKLNDSVYSEINYHFYEHPDQKQKGLFAAISTEAFVKGENNLVISKMGESNSEVIAFIPFWYSR